MNFLATRVSSTQGGRVHQERERDKAQKQRFTSRDCGAALTAPLTSTLTAHTVLDVQSYTAQRFSGNNSSGLEIKVSRELARATLPTSYIPIVYTYICADVLPDGFVFKETDMVKPT